MLALVILVRIAWLVVYRTVVAAIRRRRSGFADRLPPGALSFLVSLEFCGPNRHFRSDRGALSVERQTAAKLH